MVTQRRCAAACGVGQSAPFPHRKPAMHPPIARPGVLALRQSKIREVANAGMGRPDVLAFWFGEPDEVTPEFIRTAGMEALREGDTFYTHNLGISPLREALAAYVTQLHRPTSAGEIVVTNSGMSALMLATQALVGPGDRAVIVTPVWPNLVEIPKILGAEAVTVALDFTPQGWQLDLQRLLDALVPGTRALYLNSPNNPTGWTITREQQQALLGHCRRHGIWIVADDAYERLYYGGGTAENDAVAPSFLDIADPLDRVVQTNTFSKAWLMTGWRLGWITAPRPLTDALATLVEYNTSCAPAFVQRAGLKAVTEGEPVITRTVARFRAARDFLHGRLNALPRVSAPLPSGAMYTFFRVQGLTDSLGLCKQLVAEHGLGLAPGIAFGPEGEGFVRWCFASDTNRLEQGLERLARGLARVPAAV
ncbi:MAG: pyridoxal phosphate-dependent aminotransferase [Rhodocyclaceae bacterium]|nr:pyridoxal phosphate-dependent aminotransferase [Rhodocyclaceae bacterium]MCA3143927.1 pyridoxal phosphate-dependent aminotransferase [Rhodocyclaceae bacterium]